MEKDRRLSEAKQKLLEMAMRGKLTPAASATSAVTRYSRENPIPLALAQEQVWRLDQTAGKLAPLHNESITIYRHGPCDPTVLERSLTEIIRRHEIWRTTFDVVDGRPIQVVHEPTSFALAESDLRNLPANEREKLAQDLANADARQPFDLRSGSLVRARLITLSHDEHRLYVTAHQSIVDGITVFDIFPSELTTLYEAFAQGKPSPLPELDAQYADFACWQSKKLSGDAMESQFVYWQKQLAGKLPVLQWPNQGKRPSQQTYRGAMHAFQFPRELAHSLKDLGRRDGATLFMVLLAGLVELLHRDTGQEDIIVGTLAPSGRKQTEFQRLMGYFLNPVALRANLSGNPSFHSLIHQMRDITLGAISNDDVPLELIAERLRLTPDLSRHPFFTVALSVAPDVPQLPLGWSMTYMDVESGGARWDLYIEMSDRTQGLFGRAQYNPDLFTPQTIAQTVEDFRVLLESVAAEEVRK
jgi:surfactin family lipopeptide synthetase A